MRRTKRAFLARVFDALGPRRVRRGLESSGHQWNDCFLTGACGELPTEALPIPTRTLRAGPFYGTWLGLAPGLVYEVARLWDRDETAFRAVAQDWLRQRDARPGSEAPGEDIACVKD